jgi:hypothetical protein
MLKIIVQPTAKCIEILEYINTNINKINKMGIEVNIEIASEKRIAMLEQNNINKLPVMITPDQKLIIGIFDIINIIEKNINPIKAEKTPRQKHSRSRPDDVGDYLLNEITSGVSYSKDGKVKLPPENEKEDEDTFDYTKEVRKRKLPSHYSAKEDESEEEDPLPAPTRLDKTRRGEQRQKKPVLEELSDEDNVDDDTHSQMLKILMDE